MRKAWAPPFMEVAMRLCPSFICGACSCLEEGALTAERTYSAQIAVRTVSVESYNTDSEFGARVSPSELPAAKTLHFSGLGNL